MAGFGGTNRDQRVRGLPRFSNVMLGGTVTVVLFVIAIFGAIGKGIGRHGGTAVRGVHATRAVVDQIDRLGNRPSVPAIPAAVDDFSTNIRGITIPPEVLQEREIVRRWEVPAFDVPRLQQGTRASTETDDNRTKAEIRELYEKEGLAIRIAAAPYRAEFRGRPNEELDESSTTGVTELAWTLGPYVLANSAERDSPPNREKGEYNRCRVRYGADGRAFLSIRTRMFMPDSEKATEFAGNYELDQVRGSEEDFREGRPVAFAYTPKGLQQSKLDYATIIESILLPRLRTMLAKDPTTEDLAGRLKVSTDFSEFSNALILATPTHIVTEDPQRTIAVVRVTFPKK